MDLRAPISSVNRFAQLTTEADENAARHDFVNYLKDSAFQNIHQTTIKIRSVCNLEFALIKLNLKELSK